jgi:hypothetical protein
MPVHGRDSDPFRTAKRAWSVGPRSVTPRSIPVTRVRRPVRIFQLTGPGLRREFPPLRTLDAFCREPAGPAQLVRGPDGGAGRAAAAMQGSPLVTVTGPGGVGKTRLVLQAAADQLPSFRDGAWLCELRAAEEGETMAQADHLRSAGPAAPRP